MDQLNVGKQAFIQMLTASGSFGRKRCRRIMEMDALWNAALTAVVGFIVWWAKNQHDELKRVQILLNRTREELAKEYSTKVESTASIDRLITRLDALDAKMDRMLERQTKLD